MILISVGLPSRFAEWCDHLVSLLAAKTAGPADLVSANTCEELALAAIKSDRDVLVVSARQPTEDLRAAIAGTRTAFLVALDDPMAAVSNLVVRHGVEPLPAISAAATGCAAMIGYAALGSALVLAADRHGRDPEGTAAAIASHFGLGASAADIAAAVSELGPPNAGEDDIADPDMAETAAAALRGYAEYFDGRVLGELVWTRDLFFLGDDPHGRATGVVDLAGGIRNLLFGPFIALPGGRWLATVTLAVSQEAAGMSFGIEVVAGPQCACLAQTTIVPGQQGMCRASLAFGIDPWTDQPISLRVANLRPAAGGRLALGQVTLGQARVHAQIPAELSAALGF